MVTKTVQNLLFTDEVLLSIDTLSNNELYNASLSNATINTAKINNAKLDASIIDNSTISNSILVNNTLYNSNISNVVIDNSSICNSDFINCKVKSDLSILSANYIQTNSVSGVYNFSGKNAFIQAESSKYGIACTGAKGYCILSVNQTTKQVKLSGDISQLISKLNDNTLSGYWSYSIGNNHGTSCFQIIDVKQTETSAGIITINPHPNGLNTIGKTEEQCISDYYYDDNGIYYPIDPTVGNCVIINHYGNHAEGQSTKALGRQTHAEGRATTADVRYSHAEGTFTYAGGMASHAEGYGSVGGYHDIVVALGRGSHAEGIASKAYGHGSHSEGFRNAAYKSSSHVEGGVQYQNKDEDINIAFATGSHAEGFYRTYAGTRYFAVISSDNTKNTIKLNTVNGLSVGLEIIGQSDEGINVQSITNWKILNVIQDNNTISVNYIPKGITWNSSKNAKIIVPSYPRLGDDIDFGDIDKAHICGNGAHAEGSQTHAIGNYSHAEGYKNITIGEYSHANGSWNKTGKRAYASGRGNSAYADGSIAIGYSDNDSYDSNTLNYANKSFAWSGNGKYEISDDKKGTFNINPVGGTKGFYIGDTSLDKYLSDSASNVLSGKTFDISNASGGDLLSILSSIITLLGGKVQ